MLSVGDRRSSHLFELEESALHTSFWLVEGLEVQMLQCKQKH